MDRISEISAMRLISDRILPDDQTLKYQIILDGYRYPATHLLKLDIRPDITVLSYLKKSIFLMIVRSNTECCPSISGAVVYPAKFQDLGF